MPDPVAFDFPTAQALVRLLKRSKNGELTNPIQDDIAIDDRVNFVWAYVPSTVTCTYDSTVKAWSIGGATTCYPLNTGLDSSGLIQWGKTDNNGVISGGITCTTWTPKLSSGQAAPVVGKGFYLGCIFAADSAENPRVLIGLPPVSGGSSGGNAVIDVVTDVICTPSGLEVVTVQLSGADYDNAVIRHFLALSDVTQKSYTGNQGRAVVVNSSATGLEFGPVIGEMADTFISLSDTPPVYGTTNTYKVLTVSSTNAGISFSDNNITTKNSVKGGGNPNNPNTYAKLELVGDVATPSANNFYGVDAASVRGWYQIEFTSLKNVPNSYSGQAGKFLQVNSGATALEFSAVDLTAIETDITTIQTDIGTLQTDLGTVQTDVNTLQTDLGTIQTDISTLQTDLGTVQTDISTLQTDLGTVQTDVNTLQTDLGTIQTDISTLQTDLGTVQSDISTLQTDLSSLQTEVNGINLSQITSDISALQSAVGSIDFNQISSFQTSLSTLQGDVTTLSNNLSGLINSTVSQNTSDISSLFSMISALDSRITALGG